MWHGKKVSQLKPREALDLEIYLLGIKPK